MALTERPVKLQTALDFVLHADVIRLHKLIAFQFADRLTCYVEAFPLPLFR